MAAIDSDSHPSAVSSMTITEVSAFSFGFSWRAAPRGNRAPAPAPLPSAFRAAESGTPRRSLGPRRGIDIRDDDALRAAVEHPAHPLRVWLGTRTSGVMPMPSEAAQIVAVSRSNRARAAYRHKARRSRRPSRPSQYRPSARGANSCTARVRRREFFLHRLFGHRLFGHRLFGHLLSPCDRHIGSGMHAPDCFVPAG